MIQKLKITDNKDTPISYISRLKPFKNGTVYEFKKGVNIILGENGSGKSTLIKLLRYYLMVDESECGRGQFNSVYNKLTRISSNGICEGIEVWADYKKNTFRLCHKEDRDNDSAMETFNKFGTFLEIQHSSQGEGVMVALTDLFNQMFSKDAHLYYKYDDIYTNEWEKPYLDYIQKYRVEDADNYWTVLMDEPDRNLDIKNVNQIKSILSVDKPNTQLIAVIHNPLLIYSLSKYTHINFIELTPGYKDNVIKEVTKLIKK